jgi:hypothetical protein
MIDPVQLKVEWRLFKDTLARLKARMVADKALTSEVLIAELLSTGSVTAEIEKMLQLRAVLAFGTAVCERGFSKMKLIKSALRNRLYIETLDALMTISLVGPDYVSSGDERVLEEALVGWKESCTRNPRKARFGNQNACKRRAHEARTELPQVQPGDEAEPNSAFELDEMADEDEEQAENVFSAEDGSTAPLVDPYKPTTGFAVMPRPPAVCNQYMKGQKVAYKFETEWLQGTYRGPHKGKKEEYKGHFVVYFDRKNSFYLNLSIDTYGCDKDWVIVKKR